nr:angiotensin-converting enzyme-like [Onthophagus taurus]
MKRIYSLVLILGLFLKSSQSASVVSSRLTESEFGDYLTNEYQTKAVQMCNELQNAEWNYATDIANTELQTTLVEKTMKIAAERKQIWEEKFQDLNEEEFTNEELKRQAKKLKILGNAALDEADLKEFTEITNKMSNIYSTAKICPYKTKDTCTASELLTLEPGIEKIMSESTDYDELLYAWTAWRDATGAKIKPEYQKYVELKNKIAAKNGKNTAAELWQEAYETENFESKLDDLWNQVKPLYEELHKYVSKKLKTRYGEKLDIADGLIPAHVFGNMWAQSWVNLGSLVKPYPDASAVDVTQAMLEQGYTVLKMFEESNKFYTSLGLEDNAMSYGAKAMITKPDDKDVLCHASAWDFCDGSDFRIKMCTQIDMEDFITVHHEMGHIQYYLQYKQLQIALRGGANPGFHEAVGDTIALSVATPKHLEKVGLLQNYVDSEEASINALMDMALERVAFLPFGLLIDKWRWDVFNGKVTEQDWNKQWWKYREEIQKVKRPVESKDTDFDPAAKYHVAGDSQYINYFVAHILEFQMYRGLCAAAGEYNLEKPDEKPLHKCDFYESTAAGTKLKDGLSLGASKHWSEALKAMTGETDLDASALLDYFKPLYNWLKIQNMDEETLKTYLDDYYKEAQTFYYNQVVASWNFATDVANTDAQNEEVKATLALAEFTKKHWTDTFQYLNEDDYQDENVKRQLHFLKVLGNAALGTEKLSELTNTISDMTNIYSAAKICPYTNKECDLSKDGLNLEPGIESILSKSNDYDELEYAWTEWRKASGAKMIDHYKKYVELSNEAAVANHFADKGEMWMSWFETTDFVQNLDDLWSTVKPLYDELHKYVGGKLKEKYGDKIDIEDGLIPAHVFGNMWAQSWINLSPLVTPYPNASEVNVTKAMEEADYDVKKMFEMSNEFYTSLGLLDNSVSYGDDSMIVKPNDKEVLCHASAWDFYDAKTFRIKMCTEIDYEDFITVHHEMGHIQYFLQYKDQPITLRDGANPGFHEAIGDTIALSVSTPKHLQEIGLLKDYEDDKEASMNALMDMALERVAFLPFGLLIDKWRWDVFSGTVTQDKWNDKWWEYRKQIQKVKPPVQRSETDFDPGAKYHVAGDSQYISYFVAHILEFQLYRSLCIAAGEYDANDENKPLHKCDFYKSKEAGTKLSAGLKLGSSQHWEEVLKAMTGENALDASALMDYFKPLYQWLKVQNKNEAEIKALLNDYNEESKTFYYNQVEAAWNLATDVNNEEAQKEDVKQTLALADFKKEHWTNTFQYLIEDNYKDEDLKRQIHLLKVLGNAALDSDKLSKLTTTIADMTNIYSAAKICPYTNKECDLSKDGLNLEPGIESILSKSNDYDELEYAWTEWRKASGAKMRNLYKTYVELSNEAAKANSFTDKGEMWMSSFETDGFVENLEELWKTIEPLYDELHKYVGGKLKEKYGDKIDIEDGLIPAHVFGNMWAQSWINLSPLVKPYPNESEVDVTKAMQEAGYDVKKMFEMSNEFYKSLGLLDNSVSYGDDSMIIKPNDKEVLCHASAWDFYDAKTFRIKMCTEVDYEDFITVHHEMGHIQYYLQYKDQPIVLRDGANPGFHEAVGDTIALSVATPQHLEKIELLKDYKDTEEASINALMDMALERVAFLPFGLLIDKWRWDVFSGEVAEDQWNAKWWEYRKNIQKVKPPVQRSETDFDPGAKFHVAGDYQYISYFVAHVLEFQFYRSLCITAGQYDPKDSSKPLHKCDFYTSKEAGSQLSVGLKLGSSKHWKEVLKAMTEEEALDASALMEYFDPLYKYLKEYNGGTFTTKSSMLTLLVGLLVYRFLA